MFLLQVRHILLGQPEDDEDAEELLSVINNAHIQVAVPPAPRINSSSFLLHIHLPRLYLIIHQSLANHLSQREIKFRNVKFHLLNTSSYKYISRKLF